MWYVIIVYKSIKKSAIFTSDLDVNTVSTIILVSEKKKMKNFYEVMSLSKREKST